MVRQDGISVFVSLQFSTKKVPEGMFCVSVNTNFLFFAVLEKSRSFANETEDYFVWYLHGSIAIGCEDDDNQECIRLRGSNYSIVKACDEDAKTMKWGIFSNMKSG